MLGQKSRYFFATVDAEHGICVEKFYVADNLYDAMERYLDYLGELLGLESDEINDLFLSNTNIEKCEAMYV